MEGNERHEWAEKDEGALRGKRQERCRKRKQSQPDAVTVTAAAVDVTSTTIDAQLSAAARI